MKHFLLKMYLLAHYVLKICTSWELKRYYFSYEFKIWSKLLYKKFLEELIAYFSWYDTGHVENGASNNSSNVSCVFVTAVIFLPSRCLATIGGLYPNRCLATIGAFVPRRCLATIGVICTKPLPSNNKGTFTELLPSNDKGDTHTQTVMWSHKPTIFFQNRKVG
jgi:hypothetical protein